jgi:uncharacterized membrane protein
MTGHFVQWKSLGNWRSVSRSVGQPVLVCGPIQPLLTSNAFHISHKSALNLHVEILCLFNLLVGFLLIVEGIG